MPKVYFTADDFGLTAGVSQGIVESIQQGIVGATSAMVCLPGAANTVVDWSAAIFGRIGAHLQLTGGAPCLPAAEVTTLVDERGCFWAKRAELAVVEVDSREVYHEWNSQIECLEGLGIRVTHLDSHHHVHRLPAVFESYCQLATERQLPVRTQDFLMTAELRRRNIRCADLCYTGWYGDKATFRHLLRYLDQARTRCQDDAVIEIMCHPGIVDAELFAHSNYIEGRANELALLTSDELRQQIEQRGFEIVDGPLK